MATRTTNLQARYLPDSDVRDDYQTDFTFSDATRARIFGLVAQAHYFSGKVDSGNKKLAFTGAKKLVLARTASEVRRADYNYSQQPARAAADNPVSKPRRHDGIRLPYDPTSITIRNSPSTTN